MNGLLYKVKDNWVVSYGSSLTGFEIWPITLPLHPDDVAAIQEQSLVFDNVEARIAAFNKVEFDIIEVRANYQENHLKKDCSCKSDFVNYAKLRKQ